MAIRQCAALFALLPCVALAQGQPGSASERKSWLPQNFDPLREQVVSGARPADFDPAKDLVALHYDHAKDPDDGHSAAADRTILESLYGADWIARHVLPVSGAYGKNKDTFVQKSDAVMAAVWDERGGWLAADRDWQAAVKEMAARWAAAIAAGGRVWVKEGGQSDITAETIGILKARMPEVDIARQVVVVQHSNWNERQTHEEALACVKRETAYIRIRDANGYLRIKQDASPEALEVRKAFVEAALAHPLFGPSWKAAFDYYDPGTRQLDFSDTGELLFILGLGEIDIDDIRVRFLAAGSAKGE